MLSRKFQNPETLVDHRKAMLFVDELVEIDDSSARCVATIRVDNPFLIGDRLPGWVLMEYIAQSVAIFAGHVRTTQGSEGRHGYLLGCRSLRLAEVELKVGDSIELFVEEAARLDSFGSYKGKAWHQGLEVAFGVLSVFESVEWLNSVNMISAHKRTGESLD